MEEIRPVRYRDLGAEERSRIMQRSLPELIRIRPDVERIVEDVKRRGDQAIVEYLNSTGVPVKRGELAVPEEDARRAADSLDPELMKTIKRMRLAVLRFHRRQLPRPFMVKTWRGTRAWMYYEPLDVAGLYVPSGRGSFPSVAVMLSVPAKVAGVRRPAIASPPLPGKPEVDGATLAAGYECGVREFYIAGGAHAVAAFAYGTESIPRADVVAGPGGPYTFVAKQLVSGIVRTDTQAGPSEGFVLTDGSADPLAVAWNLLNEAEHGPDSAAILATTSSELAEQVASLIPGLLKELPEQNRRNIEENFSRYSRILVFDTMDEAVSFEREYSPEHLAIEGRNARAIFRKYRGMLRAGTVLINSPFSASNYIIGTNHVLPTGGLARSFSGLSVMSFMRHYTVEEMGLDGWLLLHSDVERIASYEGFVAHRRAMEASRRRWRGSGGRRS